LTVSAVSARYAVTLRASYSCSSQATVAVSARDGLGHVVPIVEEGPGEFLAEVGQLAGRPALVDSRAKTEVEALLISPERLRGVIIAEAELGACARSSCAGSR
jgi:CRP-like cAMP-binding protein